MTREEANNKLSLIEIYAYGMDCGYDCDKVYDLLQEIYDGFENRSCLTCKHWAPNRGWSRQGCTMGTGNDYSEEQEIYNPEKFYCSRWKEAK